MSKINIVYKLPGMMPVNMTIEDELEYYQTLVNGYIEVFDLYTFPDTVIICNEEGKLKGMKYNCTIENEHLVGPIIFVGFNDEGDFVDCPRSIEEILMIMHDWGC